MNDPRSQLLKQSTFSSEPVQLSVTETGTDAPVHFEMANAFALVGRSARCQVRLQHSDVSFRHAYLQNFGGRIFCVDLNSRSGTIWGDQQRRCGWLTDRVGPQIGPYHIRLAKPYMGVSVEYPANFNPLDAVGEPRTSLGPVQLEFLHRSEIGNTWMINRVLTLIGSGAGCKIRLEDESISKVHCGLLVTRDGLWVIDFLGRGGTRVDGQPVDYLRLEQGQILQVGQFRMRIHYVSSHDFTLEGGNNRSSTEFPLGETSVRELVPESEHEVEMVPEPPAEMSQEDFIEAVEQTGLLSRQQINIVAEHALGAGRTVDELSDLLIERDLLTAWQVDQVKAGRTEHLIVSNRYRLLDRIGHGSMGTVFRAYDPQRACDVAIKFPKARAFKKPRMLVRFRREAMINEKIQHPNIVRAYEIALSGNYIVMEYMPGLNLKRLLQDRGAQSPGFAVNIAVQIGDALQFAFRNGVIHRDVKPSNILVSEDGTAKLLDLGLARLDDDPDSETEWDEKQTAQMTQAGIQLGTTRYMSPEQAADGHSADIRSDIYGLGCTLYDLLAGHPPFDDENPVKILMMHAQDPVPPIPGLDDRLWNVLERALAKKPTDRFQTPADFVARLQDWQEIHSQRQQISELRAAQDACRGRVLDDIGDQLKSMDLSDKKRTEILDTISETIHKHLHREDEQG